MRLSEELREAPAAAEAASSAKSDFLSSMSHELRTPLNAILGFAQLLRRDKKEPLSSRHKDRVDQILKGGEHLLRLIDDILDLSRIEAGGVSISTEPVSVAEVLGELRSTLEPMAARQGLEIAIDPVVAPVTMVSVDRTRFLQILMNFGSNAIKYNRPAGRVTFTVSEPRAAHVRITVRDTGIGIPLEKQDKLFQPFQRAGQETGPIEGTGIGLVITRRLARADAWGCRLPKRPRRGSGFWVDVPAHKSVAPSEETLVREMGSGRLAAQGRKLVLYVEDNPANVVFMKDLISTFENIDLVHGAHRGRSAVELARGASPSGRHRHGHQSPGHERDRRARALRETAETADIPVIALTAAASARGSTAWGSRRASTATLTKPVKVDEFIAALESSFSKTNR